MLGNLSSLPSLSGGGISSIGGLNQGNQGLAVSGVSSHTTGSYPGLSGSLNPQRSLSLGAESLAFPGAASMGLPGSPLSFPSSNLSLPGASGLIQASLARQGASSVGRFDQHDQKPSFQQLQQQQPALTNCQFLQEQEQQGQQLEEQSQGQELGTGQQTQGQKMIGAGVPQLHNQQAIQSLASVKLEQQQVQSMQGMSSAKLEQQQMDSVLRQQQIQTLQSLPPVKLEPHQIDQSLHQQLSVPKIEMKTDELQQQVLQQSLLTSHLQRQEAMQLQRQESQHLQAHMNMQRLLHQQQQQQQLLQTLPHHIQRTQLQQQQLQQHLQQQMVAPSKQLVYENGLCARRLMQYMFHQRHRPADNNISFWRKFVAEFYAPRAKKRWCVSLYGSSGRQPTGVFPQDVWHCEICGSRPGRGFETTVEVLPRLCKIKYDSGISDELLYVDLPREREYRLSSGLMVLEYTKAIQESIFEQLRVVRDGQLRITFTPELKILSWEFCASSHEELLPRRLLVPQVTQLAAVAQKYQNVVNQNQSGAGLSVQELQNNCQMFVASARQLARTLDAPTVNDLGYTKRYVRCLQISEVVNSMKDLIDFSRENEMGPMASLINFPRRTANFRGHLNQTVQQHDQVGLQASMSDQNVGQTSSMQQSVSSSSMNSSISNPSPNMNSLASLSSLLHQNPVTSFQNSAQTNISNSLTTSVHATSCSGPSLNSVLSPQAPQANAMNSLQNFHPSVSCQPASLSSLSSSIQQNSLCSAVHILQQSAGQPVQANQHDESNTVNQLLQEMMMPSQLKGGASFHQAGVSIGGSIAVNTGLGSVGNFLSNLAGSGVSSSGSGNINGSNSLIDSCLGGGNTGNLGGSSSSSSSFNNVMGLNLLSAGGNVRNVGGNMMINNMGSTNGLGGRLNISSVTQEQGLAMQEPNQDVQNELGENDMLSGLNTSSFHDLAFNWKTP